MKVSPGQLPLDFDRPQVRASDPNTSRAAIKGLNVTPIRTKILETIFEARRPLASFQIAEILGVPRDNISPHMKPLERSKHLYRTGQTVTNPLSARKTQSETWGLTQSGLSYVRETSK